MEKFLMSCGFSHDPETIQAFHIDIEKTIPSANFTRIPKGRVFG